MAEIVGGDRRFVSVHQAYSCAVAEPRALIAAEGHHGAAFSASIAGLRREQVIGCRFPFFLHKERIEDVQDRDSAEACIRLWRLYFGFAPDV